MKKIKKILSICVIIVLMASITVYGSIDISDGISGAILADMETGQILYEYNIDEQIPIASISKLMTYILTKEALEKKQISLEDNVVISEAVANMNWSTLKLMAGDSLKLSELIEAMLIVSSNDAALAIAEHIGPNESGFVKMMNDKAIEIGLEKAVFANPHGLPDDNDETIQNYMTTRDVLCMTQYVLKNYPEIIEITSKQYLTIDKISFSRDATNKLLSLMPDVDGLKTGYTDLSGNCLVSTMLVKSNENVEKESRLIAIVMGASTEEIRTQKTMELLTYGRDNFEIKKVGDVNLSLGTVSIGGNILEVYPVVDYYLFIKNTDELKTYITYNDNLEPPIKEEEKIGEVNYVLNDKQMGITDIVLHEEIVNKSFFDLLFGAISDFFKMIGDLIIKV